MTLPSSLRPKQQNSLKQTQDLPSTLRPKQQNFSTSEEDEREYERAQAQLTSRGLETILGAPGDITSFVAGLFGQEQNILPTSKGLRELSEKASLGYTKPKTEYEEKAGEIISDVASFALPGSKTYSLARNIGIPVVANIIKEGIKYATGDEEKASYGKLGTMLMLDLMAHRFNLGGAKQMASDLFNKAENLIPKGQSIQVPKLESNLINLKKLFGMGGTRPSTEKALKKISEIEGKIKDGKIEVKELSEFRKSINEVIEEMQGFEYITRPKLREKTIIKLNDVKGEIIKTLGEYGEKVNPEFGKLYNAANESWGVYENSNKISKFLKKNVGSILTSTPAKILFGIPGGLGAFISPTAGVTGAALGGMYSAYKILNRIKNSPTIRAHYQSIIEGALKGNVGQVTKNAKMINKELQEEESSLREPMPNKKR